MAQIISVKDPEARRVRVLLALRLLSGEDIPVLDDEERWLLDEHRELREWGYGRLEAVLVNHQTESINPTKHKKRKNFIKPLEKA